MDDFIAISGYRNTIDVDKLSNSNINENVLTC